MLFPKAAAILEIHWKDDIADILLLIWFYPSLIDLQHLHKENS